jgi:hypothetical protein
MLGLAGISGLSYRRITVFEIGFAAMLLAVTYWFRARRSPHKGIAIGMTTLSLIATIVALIFVPANPVPPADTQVKPTVQLSPVSGTATTSGANSPAIVGSGNTVAINSDEPPKKTAPRKQGPAKP